MQSPPASHSDIGRFSHRIRELAMEMAQRSRSVHVGSALSIADLLAVLYNSWLHIDPKAPQDPARDRFVLSKGHGASALYAALALKGFFPEEDLLTYGQDGSRFAVHPSSMLVPGVDASTGSLGHGLSIGTGMAYAARLDGSKRRTAVIISDGECDEGATWEAALAAGHWGLENLLCILDYNKIQSFGRTKDVMDLEPLREKWEAFRWGVAEVDGHDHAAILQALATFPFTPGKPSLLIAHTVKGKGWKEWEDTVASHYTTPTPEHIALLRASAPTP